MRTLPTVNSLRMAVTRGNANAHVRTDIFGGSQSGIVSNHSPSFPAMGRVKQTRRGGRSNGRPTLTVIFVQFDQVRRNHRQTLVQGGIKNL
jgi:hypothetical protein